MCLCGRLRVEGAEEAAMGSETDLQESGHEEETMVWTVCFVAFIIF